MNHKTFGTFLLGVAVGMAILAAKNICSPAEATVPSVDGITEDVRMIDGPGGSSAYMYTIVNERDERYVVTISNTGNVTLNRVR